MVAHLEESGIHNTGQSNKKAKQTSKRLNWKRKGVRGKAWRLIAAFNGRVRGTGSRTRGAQREPNRYFALHLTFAKDYQSTRL